MNPLPRFLGMTLFVVLAMLAGVLVAPLWRPATPPGTARGDATLATSAPPPVTAPALPGSTRAAVISHRAAIVLAVIGFVLSTLLLFALALRPMPAAGTHAPFAAARQEIDTLTKLAENSAAQGEALSRERDVRRRAEEDAELKQQLLAQSVDEKIRLGRDLHDGIIQSLYAVGLTIETVRPLVKSNPAEADRKLEDIRRMLNATIRDVRGYITGLAPENLRRASFSRGVTALFEQLRAGRDAAVEIAIDDEAAARLTPEQNVEALQIAREAISNALRHGAATHITVRMHQGDGEVGLLVQDDGRGFNPAQSRGGGHGLANMQARAERLGATLRVTSEPGKGSRVVANFPIPATTA